MGLSLKYYSSDYSNVQMVAMVTMKEELEKIEIGY